MQTTPNQRILIVDDDPGVRESYGMILCPPSSRDVLLRGASLFDDPPGGAPGGKPPGESYELRLAERGEAAVEIMREVLAENRPFAAAFVDMKMPGMNGAETAKALWEMDPDLKIVIVTAYSDYTPDEIVEVTGRNDLFYLRKPFNPEEIRQFARALTNQWNLERDREVLADKLHDAYRELEEVNENLEEKVKEQTALLVQSEKMASLGVLAAGIAHEVNNPIAYIRVNLSTVRDYCSRLVGLLSLYRDLEKEIGPDALPAAARSLLEDIRAYSRSKKVDFILEDMGPLVAESLEGTERIGRLVKDLKAFSRFDREDARETDLHELMDSALNILHKELKHRVEVVRDYGDLPQVVCLPERVAQVFLNLLLNAAQAIEDRGVIRIATRRLDNGAGKRAVPSSFDPLGGVEVSVSDTGQGIPEADASRIFDPFFTTKPPGQGTGLGLSIAYDIVKSHGGDIRVRSREGEGTTFSVTLPLEGNVTMRSED